MPIDASIPLQVRQPQQPDRLNMMAQVLGIQSAQNQNALASYGLNKAKRADDESNALMEALRGGLDLSTPEGQSKALAVAPNAAQGMIKSRLEGANMQAQTRERESVAGKNVAETHAKVLEQYRNLLPNVRDQQSAAQWVQAQYADPTLGPVLSRGIPMQSAIASIPQDPADFQRWVQQQALGMSEFIKQNKPTVTTRNLGGTTDTISTEGLTGVTRTVNSAPNTQSPDSVAARRQAEQHFQAGQNAPQYMETDAGLVALPKKLAPGQQPTAVPVTGPGGQPLGKPLKDIPTPVNTAIIQNSQSLAQIDRALTLLSGKDVGAQKGDQNATGWKGYAPNSVLNRLDPKGVDTRAEISDIGSLKIHDRSGANVTVSESPRLMPFIPLSTDDAVTAEKKLRRLRTELANEATALQETYSRNQGYKPSPVKPGAAAPKPTVSNWN